MKLMKRSVIVCICLILLGLSLLIIGIMRAAHFSGGDAGFMIGTAITLCLVGGAKLCYLLPLMRDREKREKFLLQRNEERIVFLAEKSRSAMFLITIAAEYVCTLIFALTNQLQFAELLSYVICAQLLGYLVFYKYFSTKY